jgi:DNA topoisomerase I
MRLRRSALSSPGHRRVRRGRGFSYLTPEGAPVDPETLDRIKRLVIPPAWRDVWICPDPRGHIQVLGTDAAGRRQYLYHEQWRRERDEEKYDRVLAMARRLPRWREEVAGHLTRRGYGRDRVVATALRVLDQGIFRTGSEEYAEENGTFGLTTLLREHARTRGVETTFDYSAKNGIRRVVSLHDAEVTKVVNGLRRASTGSDRLFCYRQHGAWHELRADDLNERFKELAGEECTAKDLRTWNATVLAATAFADARPADSRRTRSRRETAVMRRVAEALGNTPAVCRSSYVDPRVVKAYHSGHTIEAAVRRARRLDQHNARATLERAVIRLLRREC